MPLSISSRSIDSTVLVIDPEGEVDMYTSPLLREALLDAIETGVKQIVVNLRRVDYFDSTGLGILIGGVRRLRDMGGMLRLCDPQPRVTKLLRATDLDTVMDIYSTEQEALAASA